MNTILCIDFRVVSFIPKEYTVCVHIINYIQTLSSSINKTILGTDTTGPNDETKLHETCQGSNISGLSELV